MRYKEIPPKTNLNIKRVRKISNFKIIFSIENIRNRIEYKTKFKNAENIVK